MQIKLSATDQILIVLEKSVDGYVRLEDFMYNTYLYNRGYDRILKKSHVAQAIKRLRERGLVDFISDSELILRLTDKGREKALWARLSSEDKEWDGYWRLVSFDIPEQRRKIRAVIRRKLKKLQFEFWQQSLWATKKDCADVLRVYFKSVGVEKWVLVIESRNTGH